MHQCAYICTTKDAEIKVKKMTNDFYQMAKSIVESDPEMLKLNPEVILRVK
jgi:hypothetical protein